MTKLILVSVLFFFLSSCSQEKPFQPPSSTLPVAEIVYDPEDPDAQDSLEVSSSSEEASDSLEVSSSSEEASGFSIDLIFVDEFTEEQKTLIRLATNRWEEIIVEDLPDTTYEEPKTETLSDLFDPREVVTLPEEVDDLAVLVFGHEQEKSSRSVLWEILEFRPGAKGLPIVSLLSINVDRFEELAEDGYMIPLIQHGLGHALGFVPSLIDDKVRYTLGNLENPLYSHTWDKEYIFIGDSSVRFFRQLIKDTFLFSRTTRPWGVPLETASLLDPSPFQAHWRSQTFEDELMTARFQTHHKRPISELTVALMEDLGYEVDYSRADSYELSDRGALAKPSVPSVQETDYDLSCGHL